MCPKQIVRIALSLTFILFLVEAIAAQTAKEVPSRFSVYLFLLESCKISQAYTDRIADMSMQYSNDSTRFIGLFPNPVSTAETVHRFRQKYGLPFECTEAGALQKASALGVKVTPEVVVYDERKAQILYQGRIDNMFESVGQRRRVVTTSELADALQAIQHHKPIVIARTEAVGCFLPGQ
jgi:hypothetical protein